MDFNNKFPEWKNEGATPPETLQTSGFKGGDKPPAAWLNWLTSLIGKCVAELQNKLHLHSVDNTNPHGVTASQVGLDKVNNTPDSEKEVAFASEANESRKVKYPFTIRFKGGSAEGTDLWNYDGSTSKSVNITASKIGAAETQHEHTLAEVSETADRKMSYLVSAMSEDGISYVATVNGVSELYDGLEITVIPSMTSTQAAINLNINGFGAKNIRAKINGYNSANSGTIAAFDKWFGEGAPITLRYFAKFDNWQTVDFSRPSASGLYGTIKEEQGGTGKTSLSEVTVGKAWHLSPNDCSNKDFNTLKTAGYYFGYTGMVNAAVENEISVLEVIPYSNDWVLQKQTRLVDGRMFVRHLRLGTTWSNWDEICTSRYNVVAVTGYHSGVPHGTSWSLIVNSDGTLNTSNAIVVELPFAPSSMLFAQYGSAQYGTPIGFLTQYTNGADLHCGAALQGDKLILFTKYKYATTQEEVNCTSPEAIHLNRNYVAFR